MSEEYQCSAAIIMCRISEGRPSCSCSLHLLHQDWFYSASTDPLMTLNGDALRNELNQWYNTARRKTLAFIWPQRVCLCERDYWASPARLMSSYELSWCLIIKTHYECFMSCDARSRWLLCRWAVLSAPRHKAELQTSLQSTLLHMLPVNVDNHAILTNVLYLNKKIIKVISIPISL